MTTLYLKAIPEDIVRFIIKTQGDIKNEKGIGKYSQSQTVISMLKEYKKLAKK